MSRLGLQEEEQVAVFLCLFIIGKGTLLQVCRILKVARDLILLQVS
jgi:hypothetical protein